ncbi:hypothetical protein BST61_g9675 [Cercospora zeina]
MRHYIGAGSQLRDLTIRLGFENGYALEMAEVQEEQKRRVDVLLQDIQGLALATYIPETAPKFAGLGPGKPVQSAFFSSAHVPTHLERVQEIARQIFLEWLTHQQLGSRYHTYIRDHPRADEEDLQDDFGSDDDWEFAPRKSTHGVYSPGSLRSACNYAVEASQTGRELEVFDENAAEAFVRKSSLAASPYVVLEVQEELKRLINQMANLALPLVAPRDYKLVKAERSRYGDLHFGPYPPAPVSDTKPFDPWDGRGRDRGDGRVRRVDRSYVSPQMNRGPDRVGPGTFRFAYTYLSKVDRDDYDVRGDNLLENRYGMTARDDSDIHYFTATAIGEDNIPWDREKALGVQYEISDLQSASKKWLKALDVLGEGKDVEESDSQIEDSGSRKSTTVND